ncbi:rhamnogalacturonan acetylesterase [Botrimarina sp.]|uniref:rhamnogalacturonan acetylesterase n=1 Tax=Botrimarina sp. TaxID=2795802 RepID=UPI0032EAC6EC
MKRRPFLNLLVIAAVTGVLRAAEPAAAPTIHLIGDSTMSDKPDRDGPERGWGQLLPEFVVAPAEVANHARNGRSSRSFIDEGRWSTVRDALRPGDWLIIQFGHNDQKAGTERYADPSGAYRDNLRRFVRGARAASARPVIATPVVRRRWSDSGGFEDTLGDYPAAARAVAAEERVPLLDLHKLTRQMESEAGVEGSKRFHFPGDDTHYSEEGARQVAALAAAEVQRLRLPLARWLRPSPAEATEPNPPR